MRNHVAQHVVRVPVRLEGVQAALIVGEVERLAPEIPEMEADVLRLDRLVEFDDQRFVLAQLVDSTGIDVGRHAAGRGERGGVGLVEAVAGHHATGRAVLSTVRFERHRVELVPEGDLVAGEAPGILDLTRRELGRVDRHRLAEPVVAVDEELQQVLVLPVVEELPQHHELGDVLAADVLPFTVPAGLHTLRTHEIARVPVRPGRGEQDLEAPVLPDLQVAGIEHVEVHAGPGGELGDAARVAGIAARGLEDHVVRSLAAADGRRLAAPVPSVAGTSADGVAVAAVDRRREIGRVRVINRRAIERLDGADEVRELGRRPEAAGERAVQEPQHIAIAFRQVPRRCRWRPALRVVDALARLVQPRDEAVPRRAQPFRGDSSLRIVVPVHALPSIPLAPGPPGALAAFAATSH